MGRNTGKGGRILCASGPKNSGICQREQDRKNQPTHVVSIEAQTLVNISLQRKLKISQVSTTTVVERKIILLATPYLL